jgi:DNA-binding MarR family transcriptional regulator
LVVMKSLPKGAIAADGLFVLERFVPFRLSVLANRMTRAVAGVYVRRFNVSAPEWRTLAVLGRFGAMTANNVVERTAMDKVRVSRAVTRLLELGYITRRTDPLDRRRAILDLTASGHNVYRQIAPRALAVERELLQALDPDERIAFEAAISKLEGRVTGPGSSSED